MNLSSLTHARSEWAASVPRKRLSGSHERSRKTKDPQLCGNVDVSGQLSQPGDSHTRCDISLALQKGKDETEKKGKGCQGIES